MTNTTDLVEAGRADYRDLIAGHRDMFGNPPGAAFEILLDAADIRSAEEQMAARLAAKGSPGSWARVGVAFRDQYLLVLRDAVRFPNGSLGTYIRLVEPDPGQLGVAVLPVWQEQVLLIRHFRHATRRWHLEVPRGFGSGTALESAGSELAEEIGASGVHLVSLGEMYPDTGRGNGRVALYYAAVTSYGASDRQEGILEVLPTSMSRFEQLIGDGGLEDGFTLAAFARARAKRLI